jgi:nucleoside-diphosphate-sugar epimerase
VGRAFEPGFETDRPGDVRDSQADPQLAADRFGFRAQVALGDGIGRTTAWYRATADSAG